ncbi:MAG: sigma-54 dependent transcriptional regulator, partial [Spirochaetota bacterium]
MKILVLDDDRALRRELSVFLAGNGHEALGAESLDEARALLACADTRPDLILADLYLGSERGSSLLGEAGRVPVVMISGAGGIREAVEALKAGAWDFLEKPVDPDRLLGLIRNLDRGIRAERGMAALREAWLAEHAAFAPGSPFEAALAEAEKLAPSPLSLLVQGPSGSGKEVIARWTHYCSPRSGGPFVAVNCAAVPLELAESLFFGVERGSYTGADSNRAGWFQAASGGTLFLDELGEIPLPIQAKLLRAVESGEVQRLGSTKPERVALRVISATNRDLEAEAAAGRFREDLFWRLAQATIRVPSLAERRDDIPLLARWFLAQARGASFDAGAIAWLGSRPWPGNVRELRDLV